MRMPKGSYPLQTWPAAERPFMNNPAFATLKEAFLYCRGSGRELHEGSVRFLPRLSRGSVLAIR